MPLQLGPGPGSTRLEWPAAAAEEAACCCHAACALRQRHEAASDQDTAEAKAGRAAMAGGSGVRVLRFFAQLSVRNLLLRAVRFGLFSAPGPVLPYERHCHGPPRLLAAPPREYAPGPAGLSVPCRPSCRPLGVPASAHTPLLERELRQTCVRVPATSHLCAPDETRAGRVLHHPARPRLSRVALLVLSTPPRRARRRRRLEQRGRDAPRY